MNDQSIVLELAEEKDIVTLAQMSEDAFATDANTQVKYGREPRGTFAREMAEGIGSWISRPHRCTLLRAVDISSSAREIIGWVCWGYSQGWDQGPAPVPTPAPIPGPTTTESSSKGGDRGNELPQQTDFNKSKVEMLKDLTSKDLKDMMEVLMPPETKCMYIGSIIVDPKHQGRGVGTKLIQWGTKKADEEGVFVWVHSSEAGAPRFMKQGFEEVAKLEVYLDEYAESPRDDGTKWGIYRFRYLKRMPKSK